VSLDMIRARASRREDPLDTLEPAQAPAARTGGPAARTGGGAAVDPEHEAIAADAMGAALLVVLETLAPPERLAFVLHDLFAVSFDEIAPIVGRSPAAARQLASRARRRVQGADPADRDRARQRKIVDAFLAASRGGDFAALLALLDPDAVVRADDAAVRSGAAAQVRGATAVAETFNGRAQAARPALVDGSPGAVWSQGGQVRVVFDFTITEGRIRAIDLIADPAHVAELDLVLTKA
jgi:hypothetical protein